MIRARRFFFAAGYHVVAVTLRGSGLHAAPATSLYHAGLTEDVAAVLTHLEKDKRVAGLGIVGFSLGGHVTLRLASLWGDRPPSSVRAIATISTPFDLHATVAHLDAWPQFAYRWYLLRALLHNARRLFTHVPAHRQRRVPRIRTLREYDEHVVAPMHGFASADAYYAEVSCGPRLGAIRIPTWLLHAVDDPMVPLSTLAPFWNRPSPFLTFRQTRRGGHAGFFENTRDGLASPWSLVQALPFLQTHLPLL